MRNFFFFTVCLFLIGCQSDVGVKRDDIGESLDENVRYAKGFTITQYEDYKTIDIRNAWIGDNTTFKYVLYSNEKPTGIKDAIFIKTPIKSIACMSLTHIAFIEKLGKENSIVALSGCNYVSSSKINNRIATNFIKEIGQDQHVNYEILIEQNPDFIMGFGVDASSNKLINKMNSLGLDVVLNAEYMETHPLGKAEWIKFVAAFYNEDEQATLIFNEIEQEYLSLLALTKDLKEKPTVFTGMPWSGAWYVPGAESFQVKLFKDAGAKYLWMDNDEKSSLVKSKEVIIEEAYDVDFWLNLDSYRDIPSIVDFDEKLKGFKSVKQKQLYNNDSQLNLANGNDYWESGVVNPHVVLKDLIEIFHPELIEHKLYYYRKLE